MRLVELAAGLQDVGDLARGNRGRARVTGAAEGGLGTPHQPLRRRNVACPHQPFGAAQVECGVSVRVSRVFGCRRADRGGEEPFEQFCLTESTRAFDPETQETRIRCVFGRHRVARGRDQRQRRARLARNARQPRRAGEDRRLQRGRFRAARQPNLRRNHPARLGREATRRIPPRRGKSGKGGARQTRAVGRIEPRRERDCERIGRRMRVAADRTPVVEQPQSHQPPHRRRTLDPQRRTGRRQRRKWDRHTLAKQRRRRQLPRLVPGQRRPVRRKRQPREERNERVRRILRRPGIDQRLDLSRRRPGPAVFPDLPQRRRRRIELTGQHRPRQHRLKPRIAARRRQRFRQQLPRPLAQRRAVASGNPLRRAQLLGALPLPHRHQRHPHQRRRQIAPPAIRQAEFIPARQQQSRGGARPGKGPQDRPQHLPVCGRHPGHRLARRRSIENALQIVDHQQDRRLVARPFQQALQRFGQTPRIGLDRLAPSVSMFPALPRIDRLEHRVEHTQRVVALEDHHRLSRHPVRHSRRQARLAQRPHAVHQNRLFVAERAQHRLDRPPPSDKRLPRRNRDPPPLLVEKCPLRLLPDTAARRLARLAQWPAAARPEIDPRQVPVPSALWIARPQPQQRPPPHRRRPRHRRPQPQLAIQRRRKRGRVAVVDRAVPTQDVRHLRHQLPRKRGRKLRPRARHDTAVAPRPKRLRISPRLAPTQAPGRTRRTYLRRAACRQRHQLRPQRTERRNHIARRRLLGLALRRLQQQDRTQRAIDIAMAGQVQRFEWPFRRRQPALEKPQNAGLFDDQVDPLVIPCRLQDCRLFTLIVELDLALRRRRHEHQPQIAMARLRRLFRPPHPPRHHKQLQRVTRQRAIRFRQQLPRRIEQRRIAYPAGTALNPHLQLAVAGPRNPRRRPARFVQPAVHLLPDRRKIPLPVARRRRLVPPRPLREPRQCCIQREPNLDASADHRTQNVRPSQLYQRR